MPQQSPMKVLLIAYECSPYRGSEWAVGWQRLLQAARCAETHAIVSGSNFADLLRAREEGLMPPNAFFYTPEPDAQLRSLAKEPGFFDYNYPAYHHWHRLAYLLAQQLHAEHRFDVAHQSTVCTYREPGYLWRLGIPFVWGPFGGTQNFPMRMLSLLPAAEAAKELLRNVANAVELRSSKRIRLAAKHAAAVIAATSTNQRDMQRVLHRQVERLLETGLKQVDEPDRSHYHERVARAAQGLPPEPLKLVWSGQLRSRKALPILLRALEKFGEDTPFRLEVLGDGPMLQDWHDEAESYGLLETVTFLGMLPFEEAVAHMRTADVFCFTSLRDTSGNVVLEALAAGVPVICFDHQGAADMVNDTCGVKIPVTTPARAANDWAAALQRLAEDPERLLRLSEGATEQARTFLWSANGDRINQLYRSLAGATASASGAACG